MLTSGGDFGKAGVKINVIVIRCQKSYLGFWFSATHKLTKSFINYKKKKEKKWLKVLFYSVLNCVDCLKDIENPNCVHLSEVSAVVPWLWVSEVSFFKYERSLMFHFELGAKFLGYEISVVLTQKSCICVCDGAIWWHLLKSFSKLSERGYKLIRQVSIRHLQMGLTKAGERHKNQPIRFIYLAHPFSSTSVSVFELSDLQCISRILYFRNQFITIYCIMFLYNIHL